MKYKTFILCLMAEVILFNYDASATGNYSDCYGISPCNSCGENCYYAVSGEGNNKTMTVYGPTEKNADGSYKASGSVDTMMFTGCSDIGCASYYLYSNYADVKNIVVTGNIETIGEHVFQKGDGQTIESITLSDSVKNIGKSAFYNLDTVSSITIPDSVTSIGDDAFKGMVGVTNLTIPDSVISIGDGAFSGMENVTDLTIPDSVISIGYGAFSGMENVTDLTIGNSVTSIGDRAFENMVGVTNLTIPDSVTSIENGAFYGMNLKELTIPNGVQINLAQFLDDENTEDWSTSDLLDAFSVHDADWLNDIISDFENTGWNFKNIPTIYCKGDPEDCKANLYWPEELKDYFNPLNNIQIKEAIVVTDNPDGSQTLKTWRGKIIGYKGKRIYTLDEANQVAGKTNRVSIKYR